MKVFLDMDGVLVDLVKGMCLAHGRYNPWNFSANLGVYDFKALWSISDEELWAPTNSVEFWENLEPTPRAEEIVSIVTSAYDDVCLLSTPTLNPNCMIGKLRWIEKHFPQFSRRYIFTAVKGMLAHPNALLIDDSDTVVESFVCAGGKTILYPAPWNCMHKHSHCSLALLLETLLEMTNDTNSKGSKDSEADAEIIFGGKSATGL